MRTRADQVEIGNGRIAIVRAQPAALRQARLKREGAAQIGVEIHREVARCVMEADHDPVMNVGDQAAADFLQNALFQHRPDLLPVNRQLAHMRDGHQRAERALARRRDGRISDGWMMQVNHEIARQHAMGEDVVEQSPVTVAEQH